MEAGVRAVTDQAGLYRTSPLPPGTYTVRLQLLGYAQVEQTVTVESRQSSTLDFAVAPRAIQVEGIVIETAATGASGSIDALLASQRAAAEVSDGISAEQIARSPDSNAGDAIARVTGVSVVDNRYVVVRGLSERYSNTTLNGAALASPEPTKRVVPLDVFPAALLESVVTSKTATPDKPGDFAGGSVNITTKEFPNDRVLQFKTSAGYNSLNTFAELPLPRFEGRDHFALDGQGRFTGEPSETVRFAQAQRSSWTPPIQRHIPEYGFGLTVGDQVGEFERALGYVLSFDYDQGAGYDPGRLFAFFDKADATDPLIEAISENSTRNARWGVVGNLSLRLGAANTVGIKNLTTREAEETFNLRLGSDPEVQGSGFTDQIRSTQIKYVTRTLSQTQLFGRHYLQGLADSNLEWQIGATYAGRDEPENRTINQLFNIDRNAWQINRSEPNNYWFRFLDEWAYSTSLDWETPWRVSDGVSGLVKIGGAARVRRRDFAASRYDLNINTNFVEGDLFRAGLETLTAPENIGRNLQWRVSAVGGLPYEADEDVYAGYGLVDLSLGRLRLLGGARYEQWVLDVFNLPDFSTGRDESLLLLSGNATWRLSDQINLRAAAYETVARPDPREISQSEYEEISQECTTRGNPGLQSTPILNGDVRFEWFPSAGDMVSLSGFYKSFDRPVIIVVNVVSITCQLQPANAVSAVSYGGEFELRKNLFAGFSILGNFTYTQGETTPGEIFGEEKLPLQDQSDYLANVSLSWTSPGSGVTWSVLYNYFSDRVRRFGSLQQIPGTTTFTRTPDMVEIGRGTLDAKAAADLGRYQLTLSMNNLTNERVTMIQSNVANAERPVGITNLGRRISLGLTVNVW